MKRLVSALAGFAVIFLTIPIWLYLLYQILQRVGASELMWFLYWIYVPATLIVQIAIKLTEEY